MRARVLPCAAVTSPAGEFPQGRTELVLIGMPLDSGQTILLVLVVLSIAVVLWRTHRRLAGSQRARPRRSAPEEDTRDVRRTMERLLVELHEVSREMNGRLDTKISVLNNLIREADEKIRHMETLVAEARSMSASADAAPPRRSVAPREPIGPTPDGSAPLGGRSSDARPARRRGSPSSAPNGVAPPPRYAEIYALADQGLDPTQIAQQTGVPTGEVELILGLRGRKP